MASFESMQAQLEGLDPLDVPTPGESLTTEPEASKAYEKPPEFSQVGDAVEDMFMRLTAEDTIDQFLDLMRDGMPVENIAQVVLFEGFRQGMYNLDVMLLLIEPTIYILLYLADYANINNVVLYPQGDKASIRPPTKEEGMGGEGTITVGKEQVARPEAVSPTLLEKLKGGESKEPMTEEKE
jgi:hypothetical protein